MLVKLVRNEPEIKGGKTVAYLPEESVQKALDKGWKRAENVKINVVESANNAPKNNENVVEKQNVEPVENKTSSKTVSRKKTSK